MNEVSQALMAQISEVLTAKRNNEGDEKVAKLVAKAAGRLLKMRMKAKETVEAVDELRNQTSQLSTEVDQHHLQLQSLLYEKNHYNKEIASCRSFRSPYSKEDIGLVSEEDFRAKAPESLKVGLEDGHTLMLRRLAHEKQERLDLLSQLEALKQSKEAVSQEVAGKRKHLNDVQTELSATKERALPIFKLLNLVHHDRAANQTLLTTASQLPVPLFILWHQASALKEAFGTDIELAILGSQKDAETWSQSGGSAVFKPDVESGPPSKKRRKTDQKAQTDIPEVLAAHPLSLTMKVNVAGKAPLMLNFLYLPKLETVTVRSSDALQQQILSKVYPDDLGMDLPSEAAKQVLAEQGLDFSADRPDRPYLWAQHICGLDLLPSLSATGSSSEAQDKETVSEGLVLYRKQQRFQDIVQLIIKAVKLDEPRSKQAQVVVAAKKNPIVKRTLTFDEIVAKRRQNEEQKAATLGETSQSLAKKNGTAEKGQQTVIVEEDNAMPEEGELPDD